MTEAETRTETPTETHEHRSIWGHLMKTAFTQGWVDAGGIRTRYVQAGPKDAPAVVMLHGTGSSWECFAATLESHAQHFNCYAIDMVGTGYTDKPDTPYEIPYYAEHVKNFMDAMGIAKASIIGVSLGAWVAGRFTVTYPERVERLTLLAPSGMIVNKETMARTKSVRTKAAGEPTWDTIKPVFNSILYAEKDRIPDLVQVRLAIYQQPEMKQAMQNILVLQTEEGRVRNLIGEDEWRGVKQPIFIIIAPDDVPDYTITGKRIKEIGQDVTTMTITGVKHWAHFERPDLFNPANIAFLKGETVVGAD